ncbi:MAG: acyltransferase [Treponema sp.]|nr:acyltransferase [Treponema sp.]
MVFCLNIAFYFIFTVLIFYGARYSYKGFFEEEYLSLNACKNLQGIAAIGILLHHFCWFSPVLNIDGGILSLFKNLGYIFVAFFFFISGFGLISSLNSKKDYLNNFFSKRMLSIIICFYIMNIFYFSWDLINGSNYSNFDLILKIIGISFFNDGSWYIPAILILYTSFYFIFKNVKDKRVGYCLIFLIILLETLFFLFTTNYR